MEHQSAVDRDVRHRVMLVEDDPTIRRPLQLGLQARGYDVRAYANGATLVADPTASTAACLIADHDMPGLDGFAVLRALRERGWNEPAILITESPSPLLLREADAAGFTEVVPKPLREQALINLISSLVDQRATGSC